MTTFQKVIRYLAIGFAVFLAISIIGSLLSAVGLFAGLFEGEDAAGDAKTYTLSSDITSLDITVNAADFSVKQSDVFSVESNLKHLTVTEKDGLLTIEEETKFGVSYTGAFLVLYVPAGTEFQTIEITTGAGRLTADVLSTDSLRLELGAGEVNIGALTANKSAEIDGGAGKITVSDGSVRNLDLDMGVGQFYLTAAVLGSSNLDFGIGESRITLIGDPADYTVTAEKGIGSITVDGKSVNDSSTIGHGENRIDISGGIGAVHVLFARQSQ